MQYVQHRQTENVTHHTDNGTRTRKHGHAGIAIGTFNCERREKHAKTNKQRVDGTRQWQRQSVRAKLSMCSNKVAITSAGCSNTDGKAWKTTFRDDDGGNGGGGGGVDEAKRKEQREEDEEEDEAADDEEEQDDDDDEAEEDAEDGNENDGKEEVVEQDDDEAAADEEERSDEDDDDDEDEDDNPTGKEAESRARADAGHAEDNASSPAAPSSMGVCTVSVLLTSAADETEDEDAEAHGADEDDGGAAGRSETPASAGDASLMKSSGTPKSSPRC